MLQATTRKNHYNNATWLPSIFDDFFKDEFMGVPVSRQFATPATNIRETEKNYEIQVAAPGMTKEDFHIDINENGELVISLEKKENKEQKDEPKGAWLRREFSYASFSQRFVIPEDVELENIGAKMENGILSIDLPKKEIVETVPATRRIEIR